MKYTRKDAHDVFEDFWKDAPRNKYLVIDSSTLVNVRTGEIVRGNTRLYSFGISHVSPGDYIYLPVDCLPFIEEINGYLYGCLSQYCDEFFAIDAWFRRNLGCSFYKSGLLGHVY